MKKVLVLDFGGQYNLLVARRVRECGVYCEIKSFRTSTEEVRAFGPDALIFTGGPATVFEPNAPMVDKALFEMGIPVLGICYGQQLMMHLLGGQCRKAETREYGKISADPQRLPPVRRRAGDLRVLDEPRRGGGAAGPVVSVPSLVLTAAGAPLCAAPRRTCTACSSTPRCCTPSTARRFCRTSCTASAACSGSGPWPTIWRRLWRECRRKRSAVGRVLLALSGGVDSSVAAALLQRAVGDQ